MKNTENIMIIGHGGQGVLKSAKLLAEYYFASGYDVKTSTLIGLGVRGGGVYSHIKCGQEVKSPLIMAGKCDLIIGLEKLESIRCLDYLKSDGELLVNDLYITPTTVSNGLEEEFIEDFEVIFRKKTSKLYTYKGSDIVEKIGVETALNTFFLGVASCLLKQDESVWQKVLECNISKKYLDANIKAFIKGRQVF